MNIWGWRCTSKSQIVRRNNSEFNQVCKNPLWFTIVDNLFDFVQLEWVVLYGFSISIKSLELLLFFVQLWLFLPCHIISLNALIRLKWQRPNSFIFYFAFSQSLKDKFKPFTNKNTVPLFSDYSCHFCAFIKQNLSLKLIGMSGLVFRFGYLTPTPSADARFQFVTSVNNTDYFKAKKTCVYTHSVNTYSDSRLMLINPFSRKTITNLKSSFWLGRMDKFAMGREPPHVSILYFSHSSQTLVR